MCKAGDIIVIKGVKRDNKDIGKHSFVVLSTENGQIEGMPFDMVCNVMSSFEGKSQEYKTKKLSYPENFAYDASKENIPNGHGKDGFIKAGVFFYFDRQNTDFYVLGNIEIELFNRLIEYISKLDEIQNVIDNL